VERVFRRSHDLDVCNSVLYLQCSFFYVLHVWYIVRLAFVAVRSPRACNKQVG